MTEDIEKKDEYEHAMLTVGVATACGITHIKNASVTVYYNGHPGAEHKESDGCLTDEGGRSKTFLIPCKRAKIGNRYINFPRYPKCDIAISADGYVPLKVRDIPIFPGITVVRYFDLIPLSEK